MAEKTTNGDKMRFLIQEGLLDPTEAIVRANRILQRNFLFDDPYNMEPTHESYHMDPITWQHSPNGDPEWLYVLKRQGYLMDLMFAAQAQKDPRYLTDARTLIFDWIDQNLAHPETWRTIDTGIRLMNWAPVVQVLRKQDFLNATDEAKIRDAVQAQMAYLRTHFIDRYLLSNWGVLIVTGPLVYGTLQQKTIAEADMTWCLQQLETMCALQIADDGSHWEQSPLYFIEVWRDLLAVQYAFGRYRRELPLLIAQKIAAMRRMAPYYLTPAGTLLQLGDTDAVRIDELIQTANMMVGQITSVTEKLPLHVDYQLVAIANQRLSFNRYAGYSGGVELPLTLDSPVSGNYFGRSTWNKNADYWHVINGNIGSGHGHVNLGHFDLIIKGQPVLIDPGRYTYVDGEERHAIKAAAAHNTVMIDGQDYDVPIASWEYQTLGTPLANMAWHGDGADAITSIYQVAPEKGTKATITRQFVWLATSHTWIALDHGQAHGQHQLTIPLNFAPRFHVKQAGDRWQAQLRTGRPVVDVFVGEANGTVTTGPYSARYNQMSTLQRLTLTQDFKDEVFHGLVVAPTDTWQSVSVVPARQAENPKGVVAPQFCYALRLTDSRGNRTYVVWQKQNTAKGYQLYFVDDIPVFGNLTIIQASAAGDITRQLVRW